VKGVILQTILGHKVASVAAALLLGTTTAAAAATGNIPFATDEEPAVEVETPEVQEAQEDAPPDEPTEDVTGEGPEEDGPPSDEAAPVDEESVGEDRPVAEDDMPEQDEVLPPIGDDGEPYGDVDCDDAGNHGEYVSGVAKDESIDGNRGQIVSQAARTSCGKEDGGSEPTERSDDESETDNDVDEQVDSDDERPETGDDDRGEEKGRPERERGNNGNGRGAEKKD
jgi:hypothetical protein